MAILITSSTRLAPQKQHLPLNRAFLAAIASLFLLTMHFGWQTIGGTGLELPFNATAWLSLAACFAIGFYHLARQRIFYYSKLSIGLFIACVLISTPIIYPHSALFSSFYRLAGLWLGFLFFLLLQQFKWRAKEKNALPWLILMAVIIEAMIGFSQLLNHVQMAQAAISIGDLPGSYQPNGTFNNPDVMASFLATGFILSMYLLPQVLAKYHQNYLALGLLLICPLLTLPLILLLGSRLGLLGLVLGFFCLLPYFLKRVSALRKFVWLVSTTISIGIGFALLRHFSIELLPLNQLDASLSRADIYHQTLDMFREMPFTGYGYGHFETQYVLYCAKQHQLNAHFPLASIGLTHPYNELIFWGVEGGLLPLFGILLAGSALLFNLYHTKQGTRLALFGLLVPILVHTQLDQVFYLSTAHWITFLIFIYWIDNKNCRYKKIHLSKAAKYHQGLAIMLPLLIVLTMGSALYTHWQLLQNVKTDTKHAAELPLAPHHSQAAVEDSNLAQTSSASPAFKEASSQLTSDGNDAKFDHWTGLISPNRHQTQVMMQQYNRKLDAWGLNKDPLFMPQYTKWLSATILMSPRPQYYDKLIEAYQRWGQPMKAQQVKAEKKLLFGATNRP